MLFRSVSLQTPDWVYSYFVGFSSGLPPTPFSPILFLRINVPLLKINHDSSMHEFVISYVRTVLRVLSKYSPGLLIWPDADEGDLMDEEFDSESDA